MTPAGKRAAASYVQQHYGFSQRRACRLVGIGRSTMRYRVCSRGDDAALRRRLGELADARPRFGYRSLYALLRRDGTPSTTSGSRGSTDWRDWRSAGAAANGLPSAVGGLQDRVARMSSGRSIS